jgi:anti-anti-sigma factor
MSFALNVAFNRAEEKWIVRLDGKLDAVTSPLLEKKLHEELPKKGKVLLAMDFSRVDYLSSAGMRLLLALVKRIKSEGGKVVFFGFLDEVMEIVRLAGFERLLAIYPGEAQALQALTSP